MKRIVLCCVDRVPVMMLPIGNALCFVIALLFFCSLEWKITNDLHTGPHRSCLLLSLCFAMILSTSPPFFLSVG